MRDVEERFWPKVDQHAPVPERRPELGPCWLWTASTNGRYGKIWEPTAATGSTLAQAHRVSWWLANGRLPIPEGYEVDHLCFVPLCVRPSHLEAVPPKINKERSRSREATRARFAEGLCGRGHQMRWNAARTRRVCDECAAARRSGTCAGCGTTTARGGRCRSCAALASREAEPPEARRERDVRRVATRFG